MASRMASPCQSTSQDGIEMQIAAQKPWRTVRRTSRTECALRPRSVAISGAVALITPMPKIRMAK